MMSVKIRGECPSLGSGNIFRRRTTFAEDVYDPLPEGLSIDSIRTVLASLKGKIVSLGIKRMGLFGSHKRGDARPDSDIGFLVEFVPQEKTFDNFISLHELLQDCFNVRVELVTKESLIPHIGPHILAEVEDVLSSD
jgi:uncharacterized protein